MLASTLATAAVFFPVTFLSGVSKYLFTSMAAAVILALLASFLVATTVIPLFCAHALRPCVPHGQAASASGLHLGQRFSLAFNRGFAAALRHYDRLLGVSLRHPFAVLAIMAGLLLGGGLLSSVIGLAYFPRTDPGQFVISVKAPTGYRLEETEKLVGKVEDIVRQEVLPADMGVLVSNIGISNGFSSMYTPNSGPHTAFVQCSLVAKHHVGSYEYIRRIRLRVAKELPELSTYFQAGGLMDAILNMGMPAPIDIQISGSQLVAVQTFAQSISRELRAVSGVSDVYIPQDVDYPAIRLDIDRQRASVLGLESKEVINNNITALTSNGMIAPSYWVDPHNGNDYMLTVQYPEEQIKGWEDLKAIPIRAAGATRPIRLDELARLRMGTAPSEVDHYQLQRSIDVFVAPAAEDLRPVLSAVDAILARHPPPEGARVSIRGAASGMIVSFERFAAGLLLSATLVYLVLVAQFRSFSDPLLILLAVPTGLLGVVLALVLTGTSLNVMSLMGVLVMMGMVVSNTILIVDFAHQKREEGMSAGDAVRISCNIRMRPILMTSLATLFGLLPMALHLGSGSEAYAPLATSVIGGLAVSTLLSLFLVPVVYSLMYRRPAVSAHTAPTSS